jgi:hypothetical protein
LLSGNDETSTIEAFAQDLLRNKRVKDESAIINEGIDYYFEQLHFAIKENLVERFGNILNYRNWENYDFNKLKLNSNQERAREYLESYELSIEFAFNYFCINLNFLSVLQEKFKILNGVKRRL